MLTRDTEWRQGGILTQASAASLNLFTVDSLDQCAIVISHDCDLPNEKEEQVEIIVGLIISSVDPNQTAARSVRRLHISYKNTESQFISIELQHNCRKVISKKEFSELAKLEANIPPHEKRALKQWLAARYGRPAFPNEFENRLQENKKFYDKFTKLLKSISHHLVGIFFDLGEDRFEELPPDSPYTLRVSLAYKGIEGPLSREPAEKCAADITTLFHDTFGAPHQAKKMVLECCGAVADTFFSLADLQKVDQWIKYDYLSLHEDSTDPFLPLRRSFV